MREATLIVSLLLLASAQLAWAAQPLLKLSPAERLLIDPASVVVGDVPPGAEVTIEASLKDRSGQPWSSRGVYYADAHGVVDVSRAASLGGTYTGVDAEGLFWSMLPVPLDELASVTAASRLERDWPWIPDFDSWNADFALRRAPVEVTFRAYVTGTLGKEPPEVSQAAQQVAFLAQGVKEIPVAEGELRGVLFEPPGEGPFPLAMIVTGSGGGAYDGKAALLASKGIAALALAHFNYEGRPDQLLNIPLEYFRNAMEWLGNRYGQQRVALFGDSRGGEGVLLIASYYPHLVSAVVSGVPSNMVFAGCCTEDLEPAPAWTLDGTPLPYVPWRMGQFRESQLWPGSVEARDKFRSAMLVKDFSDPRWIPVENITAPLLLVSGEADAIWPSNIAAERVIDRLQAKQHAFTYEHLEYAGAGHAVTFPMLVKSLADRMTSSASGRGLTIGGTPAGNAYAQTDAFHRIVEFILLHEDSGN